MSRDFGNIMQEMMPLGFKRVERDDRLFDVMPDQSREKGVELWERWGKVEVEFTRYKLDTDEEKEIFRVPRNELEKALGDNKKISLEDYRIIDQV